MKLYNKIWVPEKTQGMDFRDKDGDTPSILCGPVIVLTIEELRECFDWGIASFEDTQPVAKSFEDFLKHKGINI
jgi:hypothetical protein